MTPPRFRTDGAHGFYPLFDSAERVRWALDLGVKTLQFRAKGLTGQHLVDELAASLEAARVHDAQLVVNDHWKLALDLGASWVHLGQEDLDTADLDALRAAGVGFGLSTHTPGERDRALATDPAYLALGPVHETSLKHMRFAPQGLARVRTWARLSPVPLCAIGGLTMAEAPALRRAGADLLAVVSDLQRSDATDRVRGWLDHFLLDARPTPDDTEPHPTPQTALYRARCGQTDDLVGLTDDPEALRRQIARGQALLGRGRALSGRIAATDLPDDARWIDGAAVTDEVLLQAALDDTLLVIQGETEAGLEATRRAWNHDVAVAHALNTDPPPERDWNVPTVVR